MVRRTEQLDQASPRRHAVIAGTGRAGTSFLVRFLEHCGLETGSKDQPVHLLARAGLEHNLFDDEAPYVVKDPWFFTYCDGVDDLDIGIDVLLVPIRDLWAASTSRILQERVAMVEEDPWSTLPVSSVHGAVAGGAVYSLDPVDQARILAVGFHRLIHWATTRGIPLILLDFPRIVNDGEYLVDTLWPWLGQHCERDRAMAAFADVADPDQVRIAESETLDPIDGASDAEELDRTALRVILTERELELQAVQDDLAKTQGELAVTLGQLAESQGRLVEAESRLADGELRAAETERNLQTTLAEARERLARESSRLEQTDRALRSATTENQALQQTWSWRLTRPLRFVRRPNGGRASSA